MHRGVSTQQAKKTVSGRVTDPQGQPLPGVTIVVKGTTTGTITGADGNYNLNNIPADAVLVFSFVGMKAQEIPYTGQPTMNVTMTEETIGIGEVVAVGYGTMRKKDLTGSITQIRPDKIADENPKTVQDILRGTPGLNVGFDPSAKGGGSMQIRGQRSVYTDGGHNDPLLILDGMIFYGELSEINPDDIEQIDVLKDASAAAVYGAKSANGVIIITTKKGKLGKPTITFSASIGFATMGTNRRRVFSPEGYLQYREDWYTAPTYGLNAETGQYEAYQSSYKDKPGYYIKPTLDNLARYGITLDQWRAYTTNSEASDEKIWATRLLLQGNTLTNYLEGRTFDWYDHSFRTGFNQDYNASISGAGEQMNYYMSIGYLKNEGVAAGNDYRAFRSNLKVEGKVTNWLDVGANVNFQDRTDGDIAVDWATQIQNSPFSTYADEDGNPVVHPMGDGTVFKGYNYDFDRQYMDLEKGYTVLNTIFTAKVKLPFNITYSFNVSPRYQWFYDRYFESSEHPDWSAIDHGVNREQSKRFDWSLNNTINWDYTFAGKHHVNLTLVQEAEERKFWKDRIEARNLLPTDALGFHETKVGDKDRSSFDSEDSHETADGKLARAFYSYDDRYMITASVRRDGYSAFGTSNPRATFYSTAVAWTFTNENFFNWEPMSMGKLRFSWGENGNRSLADPYIALANLGAGMGATQGYVDVNGDYVQYRYMSVDRLANPHLKWEKTTSWNIGLDYGFLDNRISGTLDYYVMPTTDMIMNQSLPGFSGVGSITSNLGKVKNTGFELSINSRNIKNDVLEWNTTFGFSYTKNRIKHLYYEYEDVLDEAGNVTGTKESDDISNKWFIGQPISTIWDYRVTGIWQTDEVEEAAKYGQRPGDPKVANNYTADDKVNADGTVTPVYNNKDKEFLGQTAPKIHWSLRNDFTFFKNLDFSFNIYSYWGHKSLSSNYLNQDNGTSSITNGFNLYAKEYWTPDNPTNEFGRLDARGPAGVTSPGMLYNRSFIRLENITLGYTLPKRITSRWTIEKLKIYGNIRNVAVWTKDDWDYWDPETSGLAPRVYTIGLNLTL
ncbi:MAG: SusC/RagA family TonB-linked outer membrane protein [Mangrovibacterium sp.]